MDVKDGTLTFPVFKKLLKTHLSDTIWTAALRLCGDCMKGALQVPVSIQSSVGTYKCLVLFKVPVQEIQILCLLIVKIPVGLKL